MCALLAGAQFVNYDRKIEGIEFHKRGLVMQLTGQMKVENSGIDSVWYVPYFYSEADTQKSLAEVIHYNENGQIADYFHFFEDNLIYRNTFRYGEASELKQIIYYDPYGYVQAKAYYSYEGDILQGCDVVDDEGKTYLSSLYNEKGMISRTDYYNRRTGTLAKTSYSRYTYKGGDMTSCVDSVCYHNIEDTIVYTSLMEWESGRLVAIEKFNTRKKQHQYLEFTYQDGRLRKQTNFDHLKEPTGQLIHFFYREEE